MCDETSLAYGSANGIVSVAEVHIWFGDVATSTMLAHYVPVCAAKVVGCMAMESLSVAVDGSSVSDRDDR